MMYLNQLLIGMSVNTRIRLQIFFKIGTSAERIAEVHVLLFFLLSHNNRYRLTLFLYSPIHL